MAKIKVKDLSVNLVGVHKELTNINEFNKTH